MVVVGVVGVMVVVVVVVVVLPLVGLITSILSNTHYFVPRIMLEVLGPKPASYV